MLALLGWNDGSGKEIFTIEELIQHFSIERVHKGGAKFDFEKAKWFNHEWIKKVSAERLLPDVRRIFEEGSIAIKDDHFLLHIISLVKDRCTLLTDFISQASFFFRAPETHDLEAMKGKWNDTKKIFFQEWIAQMDQIATWDAPGIEQNFKSLAAAKNIKPGELQLPLRVMLVGGKFGPAVNDIAATLGREETTSRINYALEQFERIPA